jgi:hypothetical protein
MISKTSYLYFNELWFQISELIQELIIVVKSCFFIDDDEFHTIWDIYGKNLINFFNHFTSNEREILPKTLSLIFPILINRFQYSFNEDKLLFLENEILKSMNTLKNNLIRVLFFREILPVYFFLNNKNLVLNCQFHKVLFKNLFLSETLKKFICSISQNYLNILKDSKISQNNNSTNIKKISKNRVSLNKIFISRHKIIYNHDGLYISKQLKVLNFLIGSKVTKNKFLTFPKIHYFSPKFFKKDKEYWFFEYVYRNLKYDQLKYRFFLNSIIQKNLPSKKLHPLNFFYCKFFQNFTKFSQNLKIRWSKISKNLNGDKFFIEKLLRYILVNLDIIFTLNQERQFVLTIKTYPPRNLIIYKNERQLSFEIQKVLNKISIIKTKILY